MAEWEELGRFLVGLAVEITTNVTRGLQNVGQSFINQLAGIVDHHKYTGGIQGIGFIWRGTY